MIQLKMELTVLFEKIKEEIPDPSSTDLQPELRL